MPLLKLLENEIIRVLILEHTDGLSLARLSLTCRCSRKLVENYYSHTLQCTLARYFPDVSGILSALRQTQGCITGSQALQVIMNDIAATWKAKDLDVSVPMGSAEAMCEHLETHQGYIRAHDCHWSSERLGYHTLLKRQCLKSVTKLYKGSDRSIDVLESATDNCIAPLCDFHSTAVVNAIFADSITCYYPRETLRYRTIRNLAFQDKRDRKAVAKYQGRGWQPFPRTQIIIDEDALQSASTWTIDVSGVDGVNAERRQSRTQTP